MKKFAIGCGIAALIIIAVGVGALIFGVRWVENQMVDAQRYERITREMEDTYGTPDDFLPPEDGIYDPARVALFARLRGELTQAGAEFVVEANEMAHETEKQRWWKEIRGAMRILNSGAGYLATADSLLLEAEMSHGEYAHYQVLMLHSFGNSAEAFLDSDPAAAGESEFINAFEAMAEEYGDEARLLLQAHARNAIEAAEAEVDCASCADWASYLNEQLERTRAQRSHLPFTDPLPASLASAFEEQRNQLAATRPFDYGTWLLSILMVLELDDDGSGIQVNFGD